MSEIKPWHDAPPCAGCSLPLATPASQSGRLSEACGPRHLWCPSCGHDWMESDDAKLAQAWRAWGAWEGCQEVERTIEENARAEAAIAKEVSP